MSDHEKFEAFKRNAIERNEETYGKEIRRKYGDETVDAANRRVLSLTAEEYDRWQTIGEEIRRRLTAAVRTDISPESEEGQAIAALHREWLSFSWEKYAPQAHAGGIPSAVSLHPERQRPQGAGDRHHVRFGAACPVR